MPILLLWLAYENKPNLSVLQLQKLRRLFILPFVAHLAFNGVSYVLPLFPLAGRAPLPLGLMLPQTTRGDFHGIISGLGFIYILTANRPQYPSRRRTSSEIALSVYLALSATVRFDVYEMQWGLGSLSSRVTIFCLGLIILRRGLPFSVRKTLRFKPYKQVRLLIAVIIVSTVTLLTLAPIPPSSYQESTVLEEIAPTTTTQTPPTTTTQTRTLLGGTSLARLDTWRDALASLDTIREVVFGGDSSNDSLLLEACGYKLLEYQQSSSVNKCAVDNGWSEFPLPFAHNWFITALLYFGLMGSVLLTFVFIQSLWTGVVKARSSFLSVSPILFWIPASFGVIIWSPMSLSMFLFVTVLCNAEVSAPQKLKGARQGVSGIGVSP